MVLVIGTEGSGHHALKALFNPLFRSEVFQDGAGTAAIGWRRNLEDLAVPSWKSVVLSRIRKPSNQVTYSGRFKRAVLGLTEVFPRNLFMSASLPFGRHPIQRSFNIPDFVSIALAGAEAGYKIKCVFLKRDLLDSCSSVLRRGFEHDAEIAARLHRSATLEFSAQREELMNGFWDVFDLQFEALVKTPSQSVRTLEAFLEFPENSLPEKVIEPPPSRSRRATDWPILRAFLSPDRSKPNTL